MAANIAANTTIDYALRALQLIFAIIVMGTDGYAIHLFRGHTVYEHFEFGNFYDHVGVPNSWGFLMFCAGWTFLGVIFLLVARTSFAEHKFIGYIRVAVEAVALLSWFAGFIAVAANISNECSVGESGCGAIKAATAFGAIEWLLFLVTTTLTAKVVFNGNRRLGTTTNPSISMQSVA